MIGQTISQYKILEKLGEGGMGVVYKAQDTKLDRFVALKFLPSHLAASEHDKARFIQEAKSAAALNHPNVCSIIDIQEHEAQIFIVMEFVDGQTLQEKKLSLSQKQAIDYGIQIAEGLAAAHEKGIVHRDIKPENIMVRKDGIVQIMDFGLAKLVGVSRLTKIGSTVGTLGYMSPEQVQGQETDHRSDIFSFGVLLYELLTAKSPFNGAHESAILYEVVNVDVQPPSAIKPEIDAELDRIVLECMEKDPNERMQSIKQVAIDLNRFKRTSSRTRMSRTFSTGSFANASQQPVTVSGATFLSVKNVPWMVSALVVVIAVVVVIFFPKNDNSNNNTGRFNISVINTSDQQIARTDIPTIALSRDGSMFAYTLFESGTTQIYVRPLNNFSSIQLKGTTNGAAPFFSPDGQWLGFVADGKIKKIPVRGGAVETICEAPGFRGASWGNDDRIYFSPVFSSGISSISSKGGEIETVSMLDTSKNERTHRWPQVLPGEKYILYTIGDNNNPSSYTDATIVIQSIETGERHPLEMRGEMAYYIEPGYLFVARNGVLNVAPFDLNSFRLTETAVSIISDVNGDPGSGVWDYSISNNGHLMYLSGSLNKEYELVSVTLDGKVTPLPMQPQPYYSPRVSPDGTKLAVTIGSTVGTDNDIWIYDMKKGSFNRLTFEKKMGAPVWSADGKNIFYTNGVSGNNGVFVHAADGSSGGKFLYNISSNPHYPVSTSRNGKYLVVNSEGGASDGDVLLKDLANQGELKPLFNSTVYESGGHISPNGRYIAYYSNETGSFEVFVRTFPDVQGKWQVSLKGGTTPIWSPDGKYIYYTNTLGKMMAATVTFEPQFSVEQPKDLFDISQMNFPNNPISNYDITPDGKQFILVRNLMSTNARTSYNMVLNLMGELDQQFQK